MTSVLETVASTLRADRDLREKVALQALTLDADGVVTMEGVADSIAAKKRALALAAATGVVGIADRIRVNPGVAATDAQIRVSIRMLFAQEAAFTDLALAEDLDPSPLAERSVAIAGSPDPRGRIEIEVSDGVVTLNGAVPSLARKRLAGAMAWWAPGVRDVVNGLAVEPPEADSPDALEEAVRLVLEYCLLVDAGQIRVGVRGDVVRLTGLVRSKDMSRLAETVTWSVLGVEEVMNEIEVRP
jgi:osmotically-inducible protein OsmY